MTVKKFLTVSLVMVMVLGLLGGVAVAEEPLSPNDFEDDYLAAPAVAGLLLEGAGVDNRYGTGRDGGNFIRDIAHKMNEDSGTDFNGVSKTDVIAYECAVAAYLNDPENGEYYPAGVKCPCAGVLDPEASGAVFEDNEDGTGTLTITLIDLCGEPILPEDFPIVPPTTTRDEDQYPDSYRNYFRANAKDKYTNDYFYYIGASWFPVADGYSRAAHQGEGVYTHTITKLCGYEDVWEIGIGPWVFRDDVYVIKDELTISIEPIQTCLLSVVYDGEGDKYGSDIGDTMTFTFSDNVSRKANTRVTFEFTQELWEGWGDPPMSWEITENVLVVTATGQFSNPRDVVGDKVIAITGLEDSSGGDIVIPDDGVLVTTE